ncbi:MAG TPA: hypothetical protein VNT75_19930, partial [Symbiobacteriaceae bacterium]|nr:hypothetical protein [Symbiobacteriaceae bacterium]
MKRIVALVAAAFLSGCSATQPAASPARVVADLPPAVSVAWAPDGQSLLYAPFGQDGFGPAMRLSLDRPDGPETVTTAPTHSLAVSPDGQSLAYVCAHQGAQRRESSICVQPLPKGEPVDLFA